MLSIGRSLKRNRAISSTGDMSVVISAKSGDNPLTTAESLRVFVGLAA